MKCPNCNAEVTGRFCEYCGSELPKEKSTTNINNNSKTIINNYYTRFPSSEQNPQINRSIYNNQYSRKSNQKAKGVGATILWLLFFFPVGLIRMWIRKDFPKTVRIVITAFFVILIIGASVSPDTNSKTETNIMHKSTVSPSASPSPTPKEFDSLEDAFKEGFEDGLGDSYEERKDEIKEDIDSIKDSIDYIFSE